MPTGATRAKLVGVTLPTAKSPSTAELPSTPVIETWSPLLSPAVDAVVITAIDASTTDSDHVPSFT